jgi:hypothetical protein
VIEIGKDNQEIAHNDLPDIPVDEFAYINTGLEKVSIHEWESFLCVVTRVFFRNHA